MTVQKLASEALKFYEQRGDGVWYHTEHVPDWVEDITYEAHGRMMPDDWKYRFVADALELISTSDEGYEEDAAEEWEPDIYSRDLLKWVSSNLKRKGYVDEAVGVWGWPKEGLSMALVLGQRLEFEEVFYFVLNRLRERLDEIQEEDS